eukprot:TRINITY_DN4367_c0_g1_i3.p5 TRINITY_DN4367_c0_g1~~TRINITY_DN4367_c0_g1_i3.p5  ORF type:complete len:127 (-),score=4.75 TRINITY_DN4367_c0_g1_i3:110-490(-)
MYIFRYVFQGFVFLYLDVLSLSTSQELNPYISICICKDLVFCTSMYLVCLLLKLLIVNLLVANLFVQSFRNIEIYQDYIVQQRLNVANSRHVFARICFFRASMYSVCLLLKLLNSELGCKDIVEVE